MSQGELSTLLVPLVTVGAQCRKQQNSRRRSSVGSKVVRTSVFSVCAACKAEAKCRDTLLLRCKLGVVKKGALASVK